MSERKNNSIMMHAASGSVRRVMPSMLRRWILALATLAALVFVPAGPSRAQSQSTASNTAMAGVGASAVVPAANATEPAQTATAKPATEPAATNGQREGITVHGHWTIEVRNPDGTVATHREFENSLSASTGPNLLAGLLSGNYVAGPWNIALRGTPGPCSTSPATGAPGIGQCSIIPSNAIDLIGFFSPCSATPTQVTSGTQPYCYDNMTESLTGSGSLFTSLTMSGTVYADQGSTISSVATFLITCPSSNTTSGAPGTTVAPTTTSPSACLSVTGVGNIAFTGTTLATPVPVIAGQTVAATVVISFQ
jgi:hypothetical protein